MKHLLLFVLTLLLFNSGYCQTEPFDTLLNRGKSQFKSNIEKPDYNYAINNLKKAIALKPDDAEAHYFLGYAYSRFNSADASTIPEMQMPLVLKASAELEKVVSLTPLYKDEFVTLDPYSKITSEWGALALCYLINNKPDSATWAFREGKKRGGFDDFILAINRTVLNGCSKNSILVSSGDNYTFPLYYLRTIEKLRPDVSFFDIGTLSAFWCAKFTEQTSALKFGVKEPARDTLDYASWADSTISIQIKQTGTFFSWLVKPSYDGQYLLRGDRLFISLLKENKFKRDVYLTKGFPEDEKLSLDDHLLEYPLLEKLNAKNEPPLSIDQYITQVQKMLLTFKPSNPNSQDELTPIDCIRWEIIDKLKESKQHNQFVTTIRLFKLLNDYFPEKDYPYYSDDIKKALEDIGPVDSKF